MTPAVHGTWRGAWVPLDGAVGRVALATSTTAYCRLDSPSGLAVAVHGDGRRPRAGASLCAPGLAVSPDWVGLPVTVRRGVLSIGSAVCVDLSTADTWSGCVLPGSMGLGAAVELGKRIAQVGGVRLDDAHIRLASRLDAVLEGLRASEAALNAAVRRVAGYGPGLTPSGDDALVGLLAALWSVVPTDGQRLAASLEPVLADVGFVSATLLRLAMERRFDENVLDVLHTDHSTAATIVQRQLGVGATSGADTLSGLLAGFRHAAHSAWAVAA